MRRSIALDNMTRTISPTDEDQKFALLHVFHAPAAPPPAYAQRPYVGRGKNYNYNSSWNGGYPQKRGGRSRAQDKSASSATITKPAKVNDCQAAMTVTDPQDSNKLKVESGREGQRTPNQCQTVGDKASL